MVYGAHTWATHSSRAPKKIDRKEPPAKTSAKKVLILLLYGTLQCLVRKCKTAVRGCIAF